MAFPEERMPELVEQANWEQAVGHLYVNFEKPAAWAILADPRNCNIYAFVMSFKLLEVDAGVDTGSPGGCRRKVENVSHLVGVPFWDLANG